MTGAAQGDEMLKAVRGKKTWLSPEVSDQLCPLFSAHLAPEMIPNQGSRMSICRSCPVICIEAYVEYHAYYWQCRGTPAPTYQQ